MIAFRILFLPHKEGSPAMKKILLVLPCAAVFGLVFTGVFAPVSLFGQSASGKPAEDSEKDTDKRNRTTPRS